MKVIYTAAHAGAALQVPIGGGGAIARMLEQEWRDTQPFEFEIVKPEEAAEDLVRYTQREYTQFCYRFKSQTTNRILREDPAQCVVLSNDISEGPDFELLARHGYRVFTIWHVDVLAFVARMYMRGWVRPEQAARWMRPLEGWLPGPLRLVFTNQHHCVRHSVGHFVMTEAMKQTILACYPETDASKIHVIPWGETPIAGAGVRREAGLPVLLTLSRISPEKGLDQLLTMLRRWPGRARLKLCGAPAYMGGAAHFTKLKRLAKQLRGVEVIFAGHLTGQDKADAFASADVYIFPSVFESYGLTLMEALSHGLPVIAFDHDGARAIVQPEFGVLVKTEQELHDALDDLLSNPEKCKRMGDAARAYAAARPFAKAAAKLASLLSASAH